MLKRILTQKRYLKHLYKNQKGITGLETAIILIAFVVVAAVFAYTVLSAGLFSTQKSQEAVYSGLQETQNTLEVKGGVLAEADPKAAFTCDSIAVFDTAVISAHSANSLEATIIHEGSGSLKIVGTSAVGDDLMACTKTANKVTVATNDTITFWAQLSAGTLANKFEFAAATATGSLKTGCATQVAISAADTEWHLYSVDAAAGASDYVGVYATGAVASGTVYIDDIQVNNVSLWNSAKLWTPYSNKLLLTLALATGGQPVDFSPGTTNTNGVWTGTKTNKLVVNYNDSIAHISDVAWVASWIGNSNSDYMLDPGEKIQLAIDLTAVNLTVAAPGPIYDLVGANHQFTLELKTPKGAVLSLQRTLPARLYGINNLD